MKKNDIFNFLFLSAQSIETATGNARITSAITFKKEVISFGFNQKKSHPFQKKYGKNSECIYLHSEIDSICRALKKVDVDDLKKCNLYICRAKKFSRKGNFITGLAMPCSGCMRAITIFKLKNVFYTTENGIGFECL